MKPIAASLALTILSGGVALADIPVDDDQQLTQKTLTQTTTTSTVPVQQNNNKGQGGINCATHQGQKGTTQNNTAQPNAATGNTAVQQYDPQSATAPANPTTAPGVATQNLESDGGERRRWQCRDANHDHGERPHLSNSLDGHRSGADVYGRL